MLQKLLSRKFDLFALLILFGVNVILFHPFYFKGLLPFPGNLLVSFYFPWDAGGFAGFDPWTTHKAVVSMDAIRMMFPWRSLAFSLVQKNVWPLWNPYNFSGTPLLGNMQSGILFPGNALFLFLPFLTAWIAKVLFTPLVFSLFWYKFLRSQKLSFVAAIFGGAAFMSVPYFMVWAEQLVNLESVLFLPLTLYLVQKFIDGKKLALPLIPLSLGLFFLGGHPQTILYSFILIFLFMILKKMNWKLIVVCFSISIFVGGIQLVPGLELYKFSSREDNQLKTQIAATAMPWKNLITMIAPDFFGNPATENFRGTNYDNSLAYFNIVGLTLALFALTKFKENKNVRFYSLIALVGLAFSLWPLALIIQVLKIPVLSTAFLSRGNFFFEICGIIVAAFGLDQIIKSNKRDLKKFIIPFFAVLALYAFLFATTFLHPDSNELVSRHNLFIPGFLFISSGALILIALLVKKEKIKRAILWSFVILVALEISLFLNKFQPFSPVKFSFPEHPALSFLQKSAGANRIFGEGQARFDDNFATQYRLFSTTGYDPLSIRRYSELLLSTDNGALPKSVQAYDAVISEKDNSRRERLFDLLGIKYIFARQDDPTKTDPDTVRFPADKYSLVWSEGKVRIYERKTVLPRAWFASGYNLISDPNGEIKQFYSNSFSYRTNIILEQNPNSSPSSSALGSAQIKSYAPNRVEIETKSNGDGFLFLSDNYYPGWRATVDGKESKIYRADYTFRAVELTKGEHTVVFTYQPQSLLIGIVSSAAGLIAICLLGISQISKKRDEKS